jgi:hypothetical protein
MKYFKLLILISVILVFTACVTEFIPVTDQDQELLVVEGLVTDQNEAYIVQLSKSQPLGLKAEAKPLTKCTVTISDDQGNTFSAREVSTGVYATDRSIFRGVTGRKYTLHIATQGNLRHYESFPAEMKPVPPVDSLYYERELIREGTGYGVPVEGAQIYIETHSSDNSCRYFRWEFTETWEFRLPFTVPNHTCWISNNSDMINVKSTAAYSESIIKRFPLNFISDNSDRLKVKYSLLAKQYSLSENEFNYWEKMKNISEQGGGLYDIIPSSIPSNIWCTEDQGEKVLGYFSVSACATKRMFIKDNFYGMVDPYSTCIADTVWNNKYIPNLGVYVWVVVDHDIPPPAYKVITYNKGCYDCTVRGTNLKPPYWNNIK